MNTRERAYAVWWEAPLARALPNGRMGAVVPLTFGRWRLIVGQETDPWGYEDGY
jgi:hypothetical protein